MTFAHIENTLTTLPTYDDAQDSFLYMIPKTPATDPVTYDYFVKADTSTGGVGGNGFIQLNVVEAKKLPATKLAEEGVYYLLTADDGNFTNVHT